MTESTANIDTNTVALTASIVSAFVGNANNAVGASDVSNLITQVHSSLLGLTTGVVVEERKEPAVSIRTSVKPDFIVCLEDGKKLKMLKRHLNTAYNMTPDQYRAKWGLAADYPMVAPNYAEKRRALAKQIGLGTKRVAKTRKGATSKKAAAAA